MPWANLSDQQAYYEMKGQGDVLLLVAGLGTTACVWAPIQGQLAKHFQLITMDNRGIGRSVARRRPRDLTHYSADLIELLDHLQVERAHIVGLSLGGIIAQRLAVDHPNRIKRLVLISCSDRFSPYLREMTQLIASTANLPSADQFNRTLSLLSSSPSAVDNNFNATSQHDKQPLDRRTRRAILEQLHCLGVSNPRDDERKIAAPTLVIAGQFDGLIPHCYARQMADAIPDSRFVLLDGVGHNPVNECPDHLCDLVMRFLHPQESEDAPSGSYDRSTQQAA